MPAEHSKEYATPRWHGERDEVWRCPYGIPGDRLWVRELWARFEPYPNVDEEYGLPIAWRIRKDPILLAYWRKRVVLLADFPGRRPEECGRGASDNKWRSPVTMPRWASRLLLEVTQIRAQRVQEISAEDCEAEGTAVYAGERWVHAGEEKLCNAIYLDQFMKRWDAINGRKNPWAANPWVWSVSFRKLEEAGSRNECEA